MSRINVKGVALLIGLIFAWTPVLWGQSYDFSAIDQMLKDSSALYLDRIYVQVFQDDESLYKYQSGWLNCSNVRLGQGSATKWISAAIMLRLAEQGWWDLDDSIGKYLPVFTYYGKGHITLGQSYSMSSGMFNPGTGEDYHKDPKLTLDQSVDSIAENVQILYPTDGMIGYDGTMMHVWGKAAEVVDSISGRHRDWRTIAWEEFFYLLGMDSTDYTDFLPNPAVAGGIETTPCDYLKFLNMLANNGMYDGERILQAVSVDEMFTDQTDSAPIYFSYWPQNHPDFPNGLDTMQYTFGAWWSELDDNGNIAGITCPGAYGHYPFIDRCRGIYGTFFCYIRPVDGGFAAVMNTYLQFMKIIRDEMGPCSLTTGVEEPVQEPSVNMFPNPADRTLSISSESRIRKLEVYNSLGERVADAEPKESRAVLDVHRFGPGRYILHVELENGVRAVRKIVVQ